MKNKIIQNIESLEETHKINVLLACETGSRAWGFPSPDSDYDVRIIYKHDRDWYLNLKEQKDSIEQMYENKDIDISGWDLRKCLRLLTKSNGALLEWVQSPIIYKKDDHFLTEFQQLANHQYSKIATMYHYLNMAKKHSQAIQIDNQYKLKKFFYALRASTACLWILDKDTMPPIEFPLMLNQLAIDAKLKKRIEALIDLKSGKSESYLHQGETTIFEFIQSNLNKAEKQAQSLPSAVGKLEELNQFFLNYVNR